MFFVGETLSFVPKERVSPTPPSQRKAMFLRGGRQNSYVISVMLLKFIKIIDFFF